MSVPKDAAFYEAQYNLRARHPDYPEYFARYAARSRDAYEAFDVVHDVAYGPRGGEVMDIFPAATPGAPVHLFIHGGYWRSLDKADFGFIAFSLVPAGATVMVMNYTLAPAATIDDIVAETRAAIAWAHAHAEHYHGDASRLFISGHSAGGHLAAMATATDWTAHGLPADAVKGALVISGLFDLAPLRETEVNDDLRLDDEAIARNSPLAFVEAQRGPMVVAVGAAETDEFRRHAREFAAARSAAGVPTTLVERAGQHHFDIVEELGDPASPLAHAAIDQMAGAA